MDGAGIYLGYQRNVGADGQEDESYFDTASSPYYLSSK